MPSLLNSYKQFKSGKVCRLTYLTVYSKHPSAVQDLPAVTVRHVPLWKTLDLPFSRWGMPAVFSSRRKLSWTRL